MTEESSMTEFGSHTGQVIKFFNRKGFGYIHDLNEDKDYFVHNKSIQTKEGIYRKLYPGEYVSYNLMEHKGKMVCSDVRGIMGYALLTENPDHNYRVFPKSDGKIYNYGGGDNSNSDNNSDNNSDDNSDDNSDNAELKEIINKEAPEGIEVAKFDGLNINEEMG